MIGGLPTPPKQLAPAETPRRWRLLRLQQEVTALQGQLTSIREETGRLVAIEQTRSFTSAERHRVAQLKLQAEGVHLDLRRLRAAIADTLQDGRSGSA